MRIIFVRHGHPNYKEDCLTPLGHLQAEAAAKRLKTVHTEKIYASTCGRAMETAQHIAQAQEISADKIIPLEFMREIKWGAAEGEELYLKGHPWYVADYMVSNGISITDNSWQDYDLFKRNKVLNCCQFVALEFDKLLSELGLQREGEYYRIGKITANTIMVVSHGGSSTAVLAHLFNLPLPFAFSFVHPDVTSVTTVLFEGAEGALITPRFELLNDARHIEGITLDNEFQN